MPKAGTESNDFAAASNGPRAVNAIVEVILPVFGVIATGYLVAAVRLLDRSVGDALGDFVFVVAVPVLIFRLLANADFASAAPWALWGSYFGAVIVIWTLAMLLIRAGFGRDARSGAIGGVSASFSNTVLIGIPLVITAYGEAGAVPLLLIISVHLPVMIGASVVLIERAERVDGVRERTGSGWRALLARLAGSVLTNPIIIAILVGMLWRMTGFAIPLLAKTVIDQIATIAVPTALFALGMGLRKYGIPGHLLPAIGLGLLKLVAMPALVYGLASWPFALPPLWRAVATLVAAAPTGVNAYLIANRFRTGQGLASNAITLTGAAAVFTVAFWLEFLGHS